MSISRAKGLITVSSKCFEYPQEDSHIQFYGISFMLPYKQSGRWQDVIDTQKTKKILKKRKFHFIT